MRVVVVGGGILGASVAYRLVRARAETVLVDRTDEGRATAAGAGIVCPWASGGEDEPSYALLARGARFYGELVAHLAEDGETELGYSRVGGLIAPDDPAQLDRAEALVRQRVGDSGAAGSIERLSPAQARTLFPPLRPDLPGLFLSAGARVDGRRLTAALRRAAAKRGLTEVEGSAELLLSGSRVVGVRVGHDVLEAEAVVVAAGAWAPAMLAPAGVPLAVAPQRGQIVHLRQPGTDTSRWSTLQPLSSYYLLAFADSRVVVGASRETGSGFDYRLTAAGIAGVLAAGLHTAPGLAGWTLDEMRIGFRPLAADGRPMLGRAPGVDGLWIGNGLGPSGLTMGPYAGALLAQAVLDQTPELGLAPYDPGRPEALA